ncbi:MAG: ribonuclease H-like domain-containing protein [Vicinamibacterales bacterium]
MTMDPAKLRDRLRGVVRPLGGAVPASVPAPERSTQDAAAGAQVPSSEPRIDAGTTHVDARDAVAVPPDAAGVVARPSSDVPQRKASSLRSSNLEAVLGGEWRIESNARSFVVRRRFDAESKYGRMRIGDLAETLTAASAGASMVAAGVPRAPFVFFDLETTGLSGGAGTHAFLIGCAWFEDDGAFVTEQHVMADYAAERGMLAVAARDLARAGALVTFNGKSFDAPVLETRYLFHRMTSPYADVPHVDVLHPARRFWGGHAELGCSLIALEQQLLGARRIGDVPGFEIPERYFQYVRGGDARPLVDVLEHNRLDLLSLAGLTARLLHLVTHGASSTDDARECLALGRVYERAGDGVRSEAAYVRAVSLTSSAALSGRALSRRMAADWAWTPSGMRAEALRSLAVNARRQRRFNEAAGWWRQLLDVPGCQAQLRREATEALAIHHEHRDRDLAAAKMFALKSLEAGTETAWGDAVRHRLARIERKMVSERPLFPSLP